MTSESLLDLFRRDVVESSRALLGATLVKGEMRARIVETEAYRGIDDPACHAFGRPKMKNMALYGEPGNSYVYFTYGNHWMFNVVCHPPGEAAAVLIRAAEPLEGIGQMLVNRPTTIPNLLSGPGKLAQAFGISSIDNDLPLLVEPSRKQLAVIPAAEPVQNIASGPRIGIALGKWHDVRWRFIDADRLEWVSKPLPPQFRRRSGTNV